VAGFVDPCVFQWLFDADGLGVFMVRGILFYLIVWLAVTVSLYILNRLRKSAQMTLLRCFLYGLGTATIALSLVLLIVYLF